VIIGTKKYFFLLAYSLFAIYFLLFAYRLSLITVHRMTVEVIDHTADIGFRITADSAEEIFREGAFAMFGILVEEKGRGSEEIVGLDIKDETGENLFLRWFNEILYLFQVKHLILKEIKNIQLKDRSLKARLIMVKDTDVKTGLEIKSATYHGLKLEEKDGKWTGEVIFDV